MKSEKLILIFEISVSAQQPSNIEGACFTVRLFSIVGIFFLLLLACFRVTQHDVDFLFIVHKFSVG